MWTTPFSWRAVVLVLSIAFAGCSGGGRGVDNLMAGNPSARLSVTDNAVPIVVPFEWHDGHLIVPVRINDSPDLRFALDTGAAATVVFETERTRGLAFEIEQSIHLGEGDDRPGTTVDLVNDARVALAGIGISGLTILHVAQRNSHLFGSADVAYFDGAIGYDVLRHFVTTIDYVNRIVTFARERSVATQDAPWQTLPIDVAGRVPVVDVQLRDADSPAHTVGMLVDSGAPSYLYLNPDLTDGIDVPARQFSTHGRGFYGPNERITGRIAAFTLGAFEFPEQVVHFDATDYKGLPGAIGLIGNGVLRNFDLVLDYPGRTLSLRPNAEFDAVSTADRSGIDLLPHRLGAYAQSVTPGSTAAAMGLADGDVVTHIDSQRMTAGNFDALKALLRSARAAVALCWRAATGETCAQLPLRDRF